MVCKRCGETLTDDMLFCGSCGCPVPKGEAGTGQKKCPICGNAAGNNDMFCENCGHDLRGGADTGGTPQTVCRVCGAEIGINDTFCGNCGAGVSKMYGKTPETVHTPAAKKSNAPLAVGITAAAIVVLGIVFTVYMLLSNGSKDYGTGDKIQMSVIEDGTGSETLPTPSASPTPTPIPAPVFTSASASSTRGTDTEGGRYSAAAVLSSDRMTKWVPSKSSSGGYGEWIQVNADSVQYVRGVEILNGYHKDTDTWLNNNRVRSCTLSFSDGTSQTVTLSDTMEMIRVDLGTPVSTTYIRLTINSIYGGLKWNDTAVTYLGAY